MFDNLFHHQKLNYEISYKFRNKYVIVFPLYFIFLLFVCLISSLTKLIFRNKFKFNSHLFLTFSQNQLNVSNLFDEHNIDLHFDFINFKIKSLKTSLSQNLVFFGLIHGLNLRPFKKIFKIHDFKFFKMNWFRICNLIFIEAVLEQMRNKEKLVILSNDHSIYNIFIINWCKNNHIPTMYIQHAPVTDKFPPLRCDYNILFSKSSEDIYSKISNINVNYKVYSDFRLIKFLNINNIDCIEKNTILVCTNKLDELTNVKRYIDYLNTKGYKITMRNHPSDKRNWSFPKTIESKNDLYTDLSENNIILCNETALILEGMICNKLIYKCSFSDFFDNYGYVKDKLVLKEYSNPQNLHLDIINKSISYDKSKLDYYTGDLSNHKIHIDELNDFIKNF